MNYEVLDSLRTRHPAWRLLRSDHAPLVASFLHRVFVAPNVRGMAAVDLAEALEDDLFVLREQLGENVFPKSATEYLNDWASPEKGWLRKFYKPGTDEAQFDLTPATEKAIGWLVSLTERSFVGTESRLLTLFALLEQIVAGTETDPTRRLEELQRKRDEIDAEIARVATGDAPLLDDAAVKDRFQQFQQLARELLGDFREVEHNFRQLDRSVREKIALWEGSKGTLLDQVMGERDAIADSDQGRSFRAFWDFLMSSARQEALSTRLDTVLGLPAVATLKPDARTRRVHYDWLEAGEHAQRTVAQLSLQLRRFLDDAAFLENRRIMDLLHGIESKALALRAAQPAGIVASLDAMGTEIDLPMERPLFMPSAKAWLDSLGVHAGDDNIDTASLFDQIVVDKAQLAAGIRLALRSQAQVSLREIVERVPLSHGLAELVGYLQLAHSDSNGSTGFQALVDEDTEDAVRWQTSDTQGQRITREARLPRVIYVR
ncbi:MAG: DUF3375 domain-containing protein [Rhodocyclaceae bacterium]|nr:DUF3375 domain-containing protein [Rhodocyclaceae bacterium]